MSAEYMWNNRIGNCWNRTYFTTYLLRSIGIPCGVDYLKQAPKSATNHCWSFIVDTTGLTCDFEGGDHRMPIRDRFVTFYELKGKIYRKMFASQKLQLEEVNQEKGIPFSLSDKHENQVNISPMKGLQFDAKIYPKGPILLICVYLIIVSGFR